MNNALIVYFTVYSFPLIVSFIILIINKSNKNSLHPKKNKGYLIFYHSPVTAVKAPVPVNSTVNVALSPLGAFTSNEVI
jgi:hypothetical protein